MQYCSLQHQTLLPLPDTFTTGHFRFGSNSSFFLELFLHSSPVAYWAPINLGSSSFSVLSFYLFILFMGFSRQEYWSGLPFPLLQWTTFCQNSPPWPVRLGWPHTAWLIELDKAVVHEVRLVSFLCLWFSFCCPLMEKDKRLVEAFWWEKMTEGETGYCSDGQAVQSIQFSHSVTSNSSQPHGLQQARPPCPSPTPRVYSNSCPLSQWCFPTISSSVIPFSCPPYFPASGSLQWVGSLHQVAKVLELQLQLQHQSFQWIFRVDFI